MRDIVALLESIGNPIKKDEVKDKKPKPDKQADIEETSDDKGADEKDDTKNESESSFRNVVESFTGRSFSDIGASAGARVARNKQSELSRRDVSLIQAWIDVAEKDLSSGNLDGVIKNLTIAIGRAEEVVKLQDTRQQGAIDLRNAAVSRGAIKDRGRVGSDSWDHVNRKARNGLRGLSEDTDE